MKGQTTTTNKGKGNKAQAANKAQAQAQAAEKPESIVALITTSLPTYNEAKKRANKAFKKVVNNPFRLFDLFSADFVSMQSKLTKNKQNGVSPLTGLDEHQTELYAQLVTGSSKFSLSKLEDIVLNRNVDAMLKANDEYQEARLAKYNEDVKAGKRRDKSGNITPFKYFDRFADWNSDHAKLCLLLACAYPKKNKK